MDTDVVVAKCFLVRGQIVRQIFGVLAAEPFHFEIMEAETAQILERFEVVLRLRRITVFQNGDKIRGTELHKNPSPVGQI